MAALELYSYFRSSAAYRVRIALNLKKIPYEMRLVHLLEREQRLDKYRTLNPQGLIPTLIDDGHPVVQSLAIIEYLEELYPEPPLLPKDVRERAFARGLANLVACDIHPLNNLRVLTYLRDTLHQDEAARVAWIRHWIKEGFSALEEHLAARRATGPFCLGDAPTVADICLVPQVFNARRFGCDLAAFPRIEAIDRNCLELAAFREAAPDRQPDAFEA